MRYDTPPVLARMNGSLHTPSVQNTGTKGPYMDPARINILMTAVVSCRRVIWVYRGFVPCYSYTCRNGNFSTEGDEDWMKERGE